MRGNAGCGAQGSWGLPSSILALRSALPSGAVGAEEGIGLQSGPEIQQRSEWAWATSNARQNETIMLEFLVWPQTGASTPATTCCCTLPPWLHPCRPAAERSAAGRGPGSAAQADGGGGGALAHGRRGTIHAFTHHQKSVLPPWGSVGILFAANSALSLQAFCSLLEGSLQFPFLCGAKLRDLANFLPNYYNCPLCRKKF